MASCNLNDIASALRDCANRMSATSKRTRSLLRNEAQCPCYRFSDDHAAGYLQIQRFYESKTEADIRDVERLAYLLDSTGRPVSTAHYATEQVFHTAELLEQIFLSGLSVRDLLQAMQSCRSFRDTVLGSKRILQCMSLLINDDSDVHSAFTRSGFFNEYYSFRTVLHQPLDGKKVRLVAFFEEKWPVPVLGSRPRAMLICQPGIREVVAKSNCCGAEWRIADTSGITIGQLLDATRSIRQGHELCPFAPAGCHDGKGMVHVHVRFTGTVEVPHKLSNVSDPRTLERISSTVWWLELDRYIKAKQEGQ